MHVAIILELVWFLDTHHHYCFSVFFIMWHYYYVYYVMAIYARMIIILLWVSKINAYAVIIMTVKPPLRNGHLCACVKINAYAAIIKKWRMCLCLALAEWPRVSPSSHAKATTKGKAQTEIEASGSETYLCGVSSSYERGRRLKRANKKRPVRGERLNWRGRLRECFGFADLGSEAVLSLPGIRV